MPSVSGHRYPTAAAGIRQGGAVDLGVGIFPQKVLDGVSAAWDGEAYTTRRGAAEGEKNGIKSRVTVTYKSGNRLILLCRDFDIKAGSMTAEGTPLSNGVLAFSNEEVEFVTYRPAPLATIWHWVLSGVYVAINRALGG